MPSYTSYATNARQTAAGGTQVWSSIANATGAENDAVAGCTGGMSNTIGYRLELYGWNLPIPNSEYVTSVLVEYRCRRSGSVTSDIRWRNVPGGWDESLIIESWPTSLGWISGTVDTEWLWNNITDWSTGFEIWTQPWLGSMATAEVDAVKVTVYTEKIRVIRRDRRGLIIPSLPATAVPPAILSTTESMQPFYRRMKRAVIKEAGHPAQEDYQERERRRKPYTDLPGDWYEW